jgi:DNA topoisomerase-3
LVIAEKPSLAKDIAFALPGTAKKVGNDFFSVGEYRVTWLFGHLLELKEPEDYDPAMANKSDLSKLPIYFPDWGMRVKQPRDRSGDNEYARRVSMIGDLLRQSDTVIHAGDPDNEGQLLVDELLRWHHYSGNVKRLDTRNTTQEALVKALNNLFDNKKWEPMGWAAYARAVADMEVGVNLSRFFSSLNGMFLPVGRVKCPTLGLVVARDALIANHQPTYYYEVKCSVQVNNGPAVTAKYIPVEGDPNLTDGMIQDKSYAEEKQDLVNLFRGPGNVEKKSITSKPPLPFNFTKLQSFCSSRFGYSPQDTLEITQTLRDKYKAITYNRTDCQYLSEEHYNEAPRTTVATMNSLGINLPLDMTIKSRCFDDSKITAHFAIIPSGKTVDVNIMTAQERNVYTAIANYYLAQFLPNAKKEKTILEIPLPDGAQLRATATEIILPGFLSLLGKDAEEEEEDLPSDLCRIPAGGCAAFVQDSEVKECATRPKPKYTKASLIEDMTRIARYVDDPYIKELLLQKDAEKEGANGSIGTDATRVQIVDDLVTDGYCAMEGKNIVSTPKGREFYRILPDEFKKADLTAQWWVYQEDIISGEKTPADLTESVLESIREVLTQDFPKLDVSQLSPNSHTVVGKCPWCGGDVIEGKRGYGCSNYKNGCKFVIWKEAGKGILCRTNITPAMAKNLLKGKTVYVKTLWSEAKERMFPGSITINRDASSGFSVAVSMEREVIGKCPMCGGDILEGKSGYGCKNWNAASPCKFLIPKIGFENTMLCHCKITKTMAKSLLAGKTISGVTLYSRDKNKDYPGSIALKKLDDGTVRVMRADDAFCESVGTCWRCGGNVRETMYAYRCDNYAAGCKFSIQKNAKGGIMRATTVTPQMAQKLINHEKIKVATLRKKDTEENGKIKKGAKFTATIFLDDSQQSEYGPKFELSQRKE